jgi:RNA polymerase sigma-70 factor (ECF subfamily)
MVVLHEDITFWSDGGAETQAARRPIHGADAVARALVGGLRLAPAGFQLRPGWVNGEPGLVATVEGQLFAVGSIEVADDAILAIRVVLNPSKLRGVELR